MDRQVDCHTLVGPGRTSLRRWCGKFPDRAFLLASISIGLSALISLALLGFAQPVRADAEQAKLANFNNDEDRYHHFADVEVVALKEYAQQIGSEQPEHVSISKSPPPHFDDADLAALHEYAQQAASERSEHASGSAPHYFADPDFAALRDYAVQVGAMGANSAGLPRVKVAEAESAFDALRELFQKKEQPPSSAPGEAPRQPRPAAPAPRAAPSTRYDPRIIEGHFVGGRTCLFCHAPQAAAFDKTLMGRINRTTHKGKFDCENCHGPGLAHLQAVGCAACHGEGGISSKPGIPNLVGQDPQYLVPAMKAYVSGQRRHELKRLILSGMGDAELRDIAIYYAQQPAARAQTPPVGDPSAGRSIAGSCANCHGREGNSVFPAWPSLAGQDALYLADAIRAYKSGTRSKAIACAGCHGEGGISKRPGVPSLVGLDAQYLVAAMKAYASGQRKNDLKKAILAGASEAELNGIAAYYVRQPVARAQTPLVGDASAGQKASALCAGCHGEQGVSVVPAWPSLAGQDAQYLADAIKGYKHGARSKLVDCAGCHGEGGVSKRPGMPSLVGLSQQYLVAAMKAYVDGQRKHDLMKALLVDVSETELNDIALYYASHPSARAQTPPVGDPAAGKAASAACAGCHGAEGVSANPAWPSLAGQDARYLADATKAYKDGGSRGDPMMKGLVAALDERTINDIAAYYASLAPAPASTTPGTARREPALVRNNLVASLDERTINDIASYFASQTPAQPQGAEGAAAASRREPVLVRNGLVSFLDDRAINNVASYYASLLPAQPASARNLPPVREPARIRTAIPPDGSSVGGIISFRKNDPSRRVEDNNAICLTCHERGDRTYWNASTHETRGVACSECHTVMRQVSLKFNLKTKTELETCFQCHKDRRAQIFRSSHMPIREGKITCSNCHNPHGTATEAMLRENSINDNCYKCHAEKRGPFLFEHAPVRENCLSCHDPHGSTNEYMLKVSRPRVCAECHGFGHGAVFSGPRAVESFGRSCQNCHTAVHGSNSPSGALLQR